MEYSAPVLPMKEMSVLLSEAAYQQADKLFAWFPFEFFPSYVLFDERWQKSPFLGRFLISNFKKGWFVYVFCGVNAAVFALWQYPSLLQLPSKPRSLFQAKRQRQGKSGSGSTRVPPKKRVMTIHDLNRDLKGANTDLLGSPVDQPVHWKTLDRHFLHSLDNIAQGRWWTILTGAISHRDLDHIGKNLISFISLASMAINRSVSNGQLFCVCLGSAVAGAAAQLWHYSRLVKRDRRGLGRRWIVSRGALGASGIVSGLSIAIAVAWPHSKVQMSVPLLRRPPTLPVWAVPVFSCVYDMWMLTNESSGIGHHAHLGGALFGGLYSFFAWRGSNLVGLSYQWW